MTIWENNVNKAVRKYDDTDVLRWHYIVHVLMLHEAIWTCMFLSCKRHVMPCWAVNVGRFYSPLVRIHYYKAYWFPDFHLICFRDAYCSPFMISYCFIEHALCFSGGAGFYGSAVNSTLLRWNLDLLGKVGAEQRAQAKFGTCCVVRCGLV